MAKGEHIERILADMVRVGTDESIYSTFRRNLGILGCKMAEGSILPHEATLLRDTVRGMEAISKLSGQRATNRRNNES